MVAHVLDDKDGKVVARISEKVDKEGSNATRIKTELYIPSKNSHKVLEKEVPPGNMQQRSQEHQSVSMFWKFVKLVNFFLNTTYIFCNTVLKIRNIIFKLKVQKKVNVF